MPDPGYRPSADGSSRGNEGGRNAYLSLLRLKEELYKIISSHSGQPFEKVEADSDRDYWMIAAEAKEYGMIDSILENRNKK